MYRKGSRHERKPRIDARFLAVHGTSAGRDVRRFAGIAACPRGLGRVVRRLASRHSRAVLDGLRQGGGVITWEQGVITAWSEERGVSYSPGLELWGEKEGRRRELMRRWAHILDVDPRTMLSRHADNEYEER